MVEHILYKNKLYVAADEVTEEKDQGDILEDVMDNPGNEWKETYMLPILIAIRNMFDLNRGQVVLSDYKKVSPFGADNFGFAIVGTVRFKDFMPDDYGNPPYSFYAQIEPGGTLALPITLQGH